MEITVRMVEIAKWWYETFFLAPWSWLVMNMVMVRMMMEMVVEMMVKLMVRMIAKMVILDSSGHF